MKTLVLAFMFFLTIISAQDYTPDKKNDLNESSLKADDLFRIYFNNINMPVNNRGVLADVNIPHPDPNIGGSGCKYDNLVAIFSAGFLLSGYSDTLLWSNGVASASLVEDYLPGQVGSDPNNPINKIYVVNVSDPPFSASWQSWKDAVYSGAYFYDGDADGIYNPVDKNNNGIWDPDEDKPDLLGDFTVWCVFNDAVPYNLRRWLSPPQGIEIRQTIFGVAGNEQNAFSNSLIIRYTLVNKNPAIPRMKNVLFGFWADPDLGDHSDDFSGCDSTVNSAFVYNKGVDQVYGVNAPSVFFSFLQSPPVYIPGVTFQDVNANGYYDDGIDIPLDSAFSHRGPFIGKQKYSGAQNVSRSSYVHIRKGDPNLGEAQTATQARYYLSGLNRTGAPVNPCTFPYGQVFGVNCNEVNNKFWFSGDPFNNYGWINTSPTDIRTLANIGPFDLEYNKNVDIITAIVIGRADSSLASIFLTKHFVEYLFGAYSQNFTNLPSSIKHKEDFSTVNNYILHNNYPNPFNPTTVIQYQIPISGKVVLEVYDLLGNMVKTLVNKEQASGDYEVVFDGSGMSSGVYFYTLRSGKFVQAKKLILMK